MKWWAIWCCFAISAAATLDLSLEDFKAESELFEEDITGALDLESIVAARTTFGGTSREALHDQMQLAEDSYTQDNDYFFQKQPA